MTELPRLVRLYIRHVAIGFALSVLFVAMLLAFNVANLGHLILSSSMGWVAIVMLVVCNGVVFSGAQFGIAVMSMAERDSTPRGPRGLVRQYLPVAIPVRQEQPRNHRRF